jgi:thiamine biosynthesis lipoprotein
LYTTEKGSYIKSVVYMNERFNYYESPRMWHGSLGRIMGTRFDVLVMEQQKYEAEVLWKSIVQQLLVWNRMLNRFDSNSEIAMINSNGPIKSIMVSDQVWSILCQCRSYWERTYGLFDITLKDFACVVFSKEEQSISFSSPYIHLDLGGYAKGFALKEIKKMIVAAGVEHALVDFGNSSILAIGHHPYGDAWKVSVTNPFSFEEQLDEITLKNEALSVSGNSPYYFGHIINPITNEVIRDERLIAVVADDPLDAEVLSTTFMIANEEEKKQLKKKFQIRRLFEYNIVTNKII